MRKIISFIIRISISIGILVFLFEQVDLIKIIQIISLSKKAILTSACLLILLNYVFAFLRWKMLLFGLGLNFAQSFIFKSFCIGYFFNLFFPSTVGGDFMRIMDLGLRTQKPRQVVASVILDRLSGYSAMIVIALLALLLGFRFITDRVVFFALGIMSTLLAGILAILFNNFLFSKATKLLSFLGKIGKALSNLHFEIYNFRNQKRVILKNFVYSLIIQFTFSFSVYLISLSLGASIRPIYFFIFVPIISSISALPISVGGLGLREASSMYLFTNVGMQKETALAIALIVFLTIIFLGLSGGIIYVLTFSRRRI